MGPPSVLDSVCMFLGAHLIRQPATAAGDDLTCVLHEANVPVWGLCWRSLGNTQGVVVNIGKTARLADSEMHGV